MASVESITKWRLQGKYFCVLVDLWAVKLDPTYINQIMSVLFVSKPLVFHVGGRFIVLLILILQSFSILHAIKILSIFPLKIA